MVRRLRDLGAGAVLDPLYRRAQPADRRSEFGGFPVIVFEIVAASAPLLAILLVLTGLTRLLQEFY